MAAVALWIRAAKSRNVGMRSCVNRELLFFVAASRSGGRRRQVYESRQWRWRSTVGRTTVTASYVSSWSLAITRCVLCHLRATCRPSGAGGENSPTAPDTLFQGGHFTTMAATAAYWELSPPMTTPAQALVGSRIRIAISVGGSIDGRANTTNNIWMDALMPPAQGVSCESRRRSTSHHTPVRVVSSQSAMAND